MATVSLSLRMLKKNWEVGWERQSVMGQVQLITMFCSTRALRYFCQQHCNTTQLVLHHHPYNTTAPPS